MAQLQYNLTLEGREDETLVVRGYDGVESLSNHLITQGLQSGQLCFGYRYEIDLASRQSDLLADDIVDKGAELTVFLDGEVVQRVHGIVKAFEQGDTGHHHTFYQLTLVPSLERLGLRHHSRIFQTQTVPEILSVLLQEMGITDYGFAVQRECAKREFCVQYRESDLDFFHRLAAEEGLIYSFVHDQGKHTLVITDQTYSLPRIDTPIPYNAMSGGTIHVPYVSTFIQHKKIAPSHSELKDYSFKKPTAPLSQSETSSYIEHQRSDYEHFDYPGRFKDDGNGQAYNQIRLNYLTRDTHTATGKSNQPALQAGYAFTLQDHLDPTANQEWLVVQVNHQGSQPQALEEHGNHGATTYANQFTVISSTRTWQANPQAKPQVDGPMMAVVVGPEGEEIYCDEHGRVKVHFFWDRYSNADEHSSCWVRVSQGWAGAQYGMMAIPRIGHEVIVSFLNGDPDQPIITGRTFHANNTPPYALPEHKTKTTWRSESHQGEGYNELTLEDQSGEEQIYLHAQKDWHTEVKNDRISHIKHDQHLTVDNDEFSHIQNNQHLTVDGEQRTKVTKDTTLQVSGDIHVKVGTIWANESGNEIHIKAGQKVVIEAGTELTVKAGGSLVKVDPAGVHLKGAKVGLNSGGSAGSGSGYGGQEAMLPSTLNNENRVEELEVNEVSASQQSLEANTSSEFEAEDKTLPESWNPETTGSDASGLISNSATGANPSSKSNSSVNESEVDSTNESILQSSILKESATLNKLANLESKSYRDGSEGDEVEYIQQALLSLGFDLGEAGADGDFGPTTKRQVELFQTNYKATNQTHLSYEVGDVDGIVGQGTLLGLDEALVEGWEYKKDPFSWHDPLDNMMLCLYSQGGHDKPHHGSFGKKIRDNISNHAGVDLFATTGTDVYAATDGEVTRVRTSTTLAGKTVGIKVTDSKALWEDRDANYQPIYSDKGEILEADSFDSSSQLYLTYMHLSEFNVEEGDSVKAGDIIGKTGVSGKNGADIQTSNPHLHFAIGNLDYSPFSRACNPMMWIEPKYEETLTEEDKKAQDDAKDNYTSN